MILILLLANLANNQNMIILKSILLKKEHFKFYLFIFLGLEQFWFKFMVNDFI